MIRVGQAPFLECSTRGDKRFSAFCAYIQHYGGTVEDLYQSAKVFEDGSTGLNWRQAKGKLPVNTAYCAAWYAHLWDYYLWENSHLLPVLRAASGLSDMFGQPGRQCQAIELWRIRNKS